MDRRLFIALVAVGAVLLVVSGAVAGALIAGGNDDNDSASTTKVTATATPSGSKGYLGLTVANSSPAGGLRVASIEAGGPADKAGLRVGDILRAVDEIVVRTPEGLRNAVEAKSPGTKVTLTYERGDRQVRSEVVLGAAPADSALEATPVAPFNNLLLNRVRLGVTIQQITPDVKQQRNLQRDSGVVVTDVTPNAAAALAGVQPNDIILTVGASTIGTVDDLQRAIVGAPANRPVELRVLRGSDEVTLRANLGQQLTLDGLSDLLPPQLRERLQQQLDQGTITAEQLAQILRPYLSGQGNIAVGQVKEVSATSLKIATLGGEERTFALDDRAALRRGANVIRPADLRPDELVLVLSMDGGDTAFSVSAFGVTQTP